MYRGIREAEHESCNISRSMTAWIHVKEKGLAFVKVSDRGKRLWYIDILRRLL